MNRAVSSDQTPPVTDSAVNPEREKRADQAIATRRGALRLASAFGFGTAYAGFCGIGGTASLAFAAATGAFARLRLSGRFRFGHRPGLFAARGGKNAGGAKRFGGRCGRGGFGRRFCRGGLFGDGGFSRGRFRCGWFWRSGFCAQRVLLQQASLRQHRQLVFAPRGGHHFGNAQSAAARGLRRGGFCGGWFRFRGRLRPATSAGASAAASTAAAGTISATGCFSAGGPLAAAGSAPALRRPICVLRPLSAPPQAFRRPTIVSSHPPWL